MYVVRCTGKNYCSKSGPLFHNVSCIGLDRLSKQHNVQQREIQQQQSPKHLAILSNIQSSYKALFKISHYSTFVKILNTPSLKLNEQIVLSSFI